MQEAVVRLFLNDRIIGQCKKWSIYNCKSGKPTTLNLYFCINVATKLFSFIQWYTIITAIVAVLISWFITWLYHKNSKNHTIKNTSDVLVKLAELNQQAEKLGGDVRELQLIKANINDLEKSFRMLGADGTNVVKTLMGLLLGVMEGQSLKKNNSTENFSFMFLMLLSLNLATNVGLIIYLAVK